MNAFGQLTFVSRGFKPDNGSSQSSFGLQSFIFGGGAKLPLNEMLSASARLRMQLDLAADPDPGEFELSDGSNMIGIDFAIRAAVDGFRLGARFYHANQLEENRPSTNALSLRGTADLFENDTIALRAGLNFAYLMGTDDSGHLLGAGAHAVVDLKDSPLSFKMDGGCTEEFSASGDVRICRREHPAEQVIQRARPLRPSKHVGATWPREACLQKRRGVPTPR